MHGCSWSCVLSECTNYEGLNLTLSIPQVRFVCMSDTHSRIKYMPFAVPMGDVLIHAGDFTSIGGAEEVAAFNEWLGMSHWCIYIVV